MKTTTNELAPWYMDPTFPMSDEDRAITIAFFEARARRDAAHAAAGVTIGKETAEVHGRESHYSIRVRLSEECGFTAAGEAYGKIR